MSPKPDLDATPKKIESAGGRRFELAVWSE